MSGTQTSQRRVASILAAGLLAACSLHSRDLLAQSPNQLSWAPTRDEAVIIERFPSAMQPADSSISRSPPSQRHKTLSRPAPPRARTYFTDTQGTTESLPSVSGAPLSPEGLPVPPEMYYDEGQVGDGNIHPNGYYNDACCGPCGPCGLSGG